MCKVSRRQRTHAASNRARHERTYVHKGRSVQPTLEVGSRYGELVVLELLKPAKARCVCDCGQEKIAYRNNLRAGVALNCSDWSRHRHHAVKDERTSPRRWRHQFRTLTLSERFDVFDRNDWTCQLCNVGIPLVVRYPHRMSPSVDHITPLSRGGAHEPANWQAAHVYCNSVKRDGDALPRKAA